MKRPGMVCEDAPASLPAMRTQGALRGQSDRLSATSDNLPKNFVDNCSVVAIFVVRRLGS